jgi:mono/diheme cytochrome c family protein
MTRARAHAVLVAALGSLTFACGGGGPHSRAAGAVAPLAVAPVEWNPTHAPVGRVRAVAEAGEVTCVFADEAATVFVSGAPVATDRTVKGWTRAATLAKRDGVTQILGIDARGHVYALRARSAFDDVSDRFGLGGKRVHGGAPLGAGGFAFLTDGEIEVADGARVSSVGAPKLIELAGASTFGAGVSDTGVYTFDLESKTARAFALEGVTHAAIGAKGRVVATTKRAVYAVDEQGDLALLYEADGPTIHGLAASGDNVWFADGTELGVVGEGRGVSETTDLKIADDAELASSPRGDVWVMASAGLSRYARATSGTGANTNGANGAIPPADPWSTNIAPVFARACGKCHLPNGPAGVDLSTSGAWMSQKEKIHERVIVKRSMPPSGNTLSDADREAIRAWTESR